MFTNLQYKLFNKIQEMFSIKHSSLYIFIFLGDLQRLYPIQSLKNFPLRTVAASHDLLVVRPLLRKEKSQIQKFLVKMSDSVDQISNLKSMTRVFATSIADQSDCKGYVIEQEKDGVLAFIVATR